MGRGRDRGRETGREGVRQSYEISQNEGNTKRKDETTNN